MNRKPVIASALFFVAIASAPAGVSLPALGAPNGLRPEVQRLFDGGHYQETVDALQFDVQNDPQNAALRYWLGRSFYELRDYSHAISSLERAVATDPNNSDYHDWLGKASGRKAEESGRLSAFSAFALARKTHREFVAAVHLDRRNLEAQRDLIRFLLNAPGIVGGGEDHALEQINDLSLVDTIEGDLARAEYFATKKQFEQADEQYKKILEGSRMRRLGVYLEIAEYYRDRNDSVNMQQAVDAADNVAPSDQLLEYYKGVALVLSKRNASGAEQHLRAYLDAVPEGSAVPSHSSAHEWLGKLYEDEQQADRAAEEYKAAIALDPHSKSLRDELKRVERK
jgi:tetratricopeptide (TPR) repeat protein